jgi:hypothetical protein
MDKRPFADPSDESKLILEYDAYVKQTVRSGGTPLTPDAWLAIKQPAPQPKAAESVPAPVEHTEADKTRIADAFAAMLIPQGFGSRAEIVRAELKQWYALNRTVNRVFNTLCNAEVIKRREAKHIIA